MPEDVITEYLIVARGDTPPAALTLTHALASAGVGSADYAAAPPAPPTLPGDAAPRGRRKEGTHTLRRSGGPGTLRIVTARHTGPVLTGLSEQALANLARDLPPDAARTLREGETELAVRLSVPEADALPALDWALRALRVLLEATHGVAVDPAMQQTLTAPRVAALRPATPGEHVALGTDVQAGDRRRLYTRGLAKFGRPEVEVRAVPHALVPEAEALLRDLIVSLATGATLVPGQEVVLDDAGTLVATSAPADGESAAPYGRLRLDDAGERTGSIGATRVLARLALAEAARAAAAAGGAGIAAAEDIIERVLAADPDDSEALALRALLLLRRGEPSEALTLGELMELRLPLDHRGPLTVGLALAAMGRPREAMEALSRAIELDPEAADAYAARADVHARLGRTDLAGVDRAHAAYLRR